MQLIVKVYHFHWFSFVFRIFWIHQGNKNLNKCSKYLSILFTGRNCEVPHGKMYSANVETKVFLFFFFLLMAAELNQLIGSVYIFTVGFYHILKLVFTLPFWISVSVSRMHCLWKWSDHCWATSNNQFTWG